MAFRGCQIRFGALMNAAALCTSQSRPPHHVVIVGAQKIET